MRLAVILALVLAGREVGHAEPTPVSPIAVAVGIHVGAASGVRYIDGRIAVEGLAA